MRFYSYSTLVYHSCSTCVYHSYSTRMYYRYSTCMYYRCSTCMYSSCGTCIVSHRAHGPASLRRGRVWRVKTPGQQGGLGFAGLSMVLRGRDNPSSPILRLPPCTSFANDGVCFYIQNREGETPKKKVKYIQDEMNLPPSLPLTKNPHQTLFSCTLFVCWNHLFIWPFKHWLVVARQRRWGKAVRSSG